MVIEAPIIGLSWDSVNRFRMVMKRPGLISLLRCPFTFPYTSESRAAAAKNHGGNHLTQRSSHAVVRSWCLVASAARNGIRSFGLYFRTSSRKWCNGPSWAPSVSLLIHSLECPDLDGLILRRAYTPSAES
jgi:hypothetical protein